MDEMTTSDCNNGEFLSGQGHDNSLFDQDESANQKCKIRFGRGSNHQANGQRLGVDGRNKPPEVTDLMACFT